MSVDYANFHFEQNGLFYDKCLIADFNLSVKEKKVFFSHLKKTEKKSYRVEAAYINGRSNCSKWVDNLKNLDLFGLFELNDSFLSAKGKKYLLFKLMYEASDIPAQTVVDSQNGLQIIDKNPVYILGEHILWGKDNLGKPKIITHHVMESIQYTNRKELLSFCDSYRNLLPGVTEILFYGSLFAIVKPFLAQLMIPNGFLLSLVAPSGHLKTTLVRTYALWFQEKSELEVGFYSRQRDQTILNTLDSLSGQNFLVDDLHKIKNANEKRRQEHRLDIISRYVNTKMDCANVILTGETMENMGIFSCIDRIFQIKMPKMDAKQIEELKKKLSALALALMPSVALEFASFLMNHYKESLDAIREFLQKNNIDNTVDGYATRIRRHALFLRMTEYLFERSFDVISTRTEKGTALEIALEEQIHLQQMELQKIRSAEEKHDYIAEFYTIIKAEDKYIKLCATPSEYEVTNMEYACLLYKERIYITTSSIKNAFYKYYGKYIAPKQVIDVFHKEGILEEEPASKGHQKNFQGKKHYVISMCFFINYLVQNSYSVSEIHYQRYISKIPLTEKNK